MLRVICPFVLFGSLAYLIINDKLPVYGHIWDGWHGDNPRPPDHPYLLPPIPTPPPTILPTPALGFISTSTLSQWLIVYKWAFTIVVCIFCRWSKDPWCYFIPFNLICNAGKQHLYASKYENTIKKHTIIRINSSYAVIKYLMKIIRYNYIWGEERQL